MRKPFISLARMIIWAHIYAPGDVDPFQKPVNPNQESKAELAVAQGVVEVILEYNDLFLEDITPEPLDKFRWLSNIGQGTDWTDWREPGTVRLNIPDMRGYFTSFQGFSDHLPSDVPV